MAASPNALYMESWAIIKSNKELMRNTAYDDTRRKASGQIVVQFNPEHSKTKRPPSTSPLAVTALHVSRPFNPDAFNFNKCKPGEVVVKVAVRPDCGACRVVYTATRGCVGSPVEEGEAVHPIFVNVNPLLAGHGLLTPWMEKCYPQVMTSELLLVGLAVCHAMNSLDFRLGFNSLGAWASVNHFHLHAFFVGEVFDSGRMSIEQLPVEVVQSVLLDAKPEVRPTISLGSSSCVELSVLCASEGSVLSVGTVTGWPLRTYKFSIRSTSGTVDGSLLAHLARSAGALAAHLVSIDLPHTILIADYGTSVYLIPRQFQRGGGAEAGELAVALAEACGLAIVYTEESFMSLDEAGFRSLLRPYSIEDDPALVAELDRRAKAALDGP